MTTQANIYIDQGADFSTGIDVVDDLGQVVDLTYATLEGQARKVYSSEVVFQFVITVTYPLEGKATLELEPEVTQALTPGKYKYDVMINMLNGVPKRTKLIEGIVYIVETVTGPSA